jgi:antitoxin (DNA-binding transcriptional repressor) of toxin-antitoxin stability system
MTISLQDAQARLPDIIHRLAAGQEVEIIEGNQIVARLVGESRALGTRPGPGLARGMITIVADDDDHLKDFAEYMP